MKTDRNKTEKLLHELQSQDRSWLANPIHEAIEDMAIAKAISEGKDSENVERHEIFAAIELLSATHSSTLKSSART
ncbi:MAG: hypothetical protein HC935_06155 [Pseudanabaena sp. SU_2_4]|nr:hypothetical protein [Pseudanabaena sp. SU_2_4]